MFRQILAQSGKTWNEGIEELIQEFNSGRNGVKPRLESDLWKAILATDNDKRHMWITRKVRYFVHRLAEAKRLRKKINLTSGAYGFRDPREYSDTWQMCAVYVHFRLKFQKMLTEEQMEACDLKFARGYLDVEMMEKIKIQSPGLSAHFPPKFQKMPTEEQMEDCDLKFACGYLDVERMEKIKIQSPGLSATDFRFLSEFGVAETLLGPQAVAKLQKEEKLFKEYKENVDNFQKVGLGIRAELVERQREAQRTAITAMQESKYPVRDLAECNHGTTFYEASIHRYAAEQGLTENKFLKEADKLLESKKDEVMSMAFESDQDVCCFRMASETHGTVCTLREFLLKIEGGEQQQDLSTLEVACHELVAQSRRLSPSEKSAVEKHSAAQLALAKKAAAEKESACRALASKAASQKEESKARQILRMAGKEESFSNQKLQDEKNDQKLQSMEAGVVTEAAGSAANKPDNEKLQSMKEGLVDLHLTSLRSQESQTRALESQTSVLKS
eukprot:s249_g7.t1